MKRLHIDIETYSPEPLADSGVYRYAMHPDFRILLVAYAVDNGEIGIIDLARGEAVPKWFLDALVDPGIVKVAHNATFERVCFSVYLNRLWLDAGQWHCTMVQCSRCGLPASLAQAGDALGLERQKMTEGSRLIRIFCLPHKSRSGVFGDTGTRVLPDDRPEDWQTFKDYCVRDVDVERQIDKATSWYEVSDQEQALYRLDQMINDYGVLIDTGMARSAVRMGAILNARLNEEAMKITGLSNPNSVPQLKTWLSEMTGTDISALTKATLPDIRTATGDPRVHRVLDIRAQLGKASNAKYEAMLNVAGPDDRARGLTQFHGARTGRWAGRLIQLQNLPQNHIPDLDFARQALKAGDLDLLELAYGNVPDTLSQLIRTALVAPEGKTFAVCDFSAIEARVLAWLAGERWVLDIFRAGGDIYCETASQMFHVPVEKHGRNAELRQKGKIAVLALGYGGAVNALDAMGGRRLGMTEQEEGDTVTRWRKANPNIVAFWADVEEAVRRTVTFGETVCMGCLTFTMHGTTLCCILPSGRMVCYPQMKVAHASEWAYLDQTPAQAGVSANYIVKEKKALHPERYYNSAGSELRFMGLSQTSNTWGWIKTFGGKLTENITQAVARDCLAEVMRRIAFTTGYPIVFHVHDEIVCEVPAEYGEQALDVIGRKFAEPMPWAPGLPLKGAGYVTPYYKKD